MKAHDGARFPADLILGIRFTKDSQREAVRPGRRLDNMWHEPIRRIQLRFLLLLLLAAKGRLVRLGPQVFIEVTKILPAMLGMLRQIIITTMRDAFEFLRFIGEGEEILDVGRADGIKSQFVLTLFARPQ